ncbi:MAG: HlyD family efflux transporter periplasmic adaptor subunit [Gammaproteobacteria bacterium]
MSSLFSPSWYRVASLKPRLRSHFEVHRQPTRGDLSFVLQDHAQGKFYRFNLNAYDLVGRMNGERAVHEIWQEALNALGDDAPTQDDTIALLGKLHEADALQVNVTADCMELFRRTQKANKSWWQSTARNPMAVRIPLFDPDRLLAALVPVFGPLLSPVGFVLWLAFVGWAATIAAAHWPELSHGGADQVLDPKNLLFMLLVFPLVKALHELGHGIATKKWGGEVHEMGITLLVFMPIPYVDATAATAIRRKWRRIVVSAAGMMVELFLASVALLVWINAEPGLVRLTAFNVMLVGGVSTIFFNGNPLLRFDAYFMLKDALEIPNLASRSSRYLTYLIQRHLFGMTSVESPATLPGERRWLLLYGIAAGLYKFAISIAIILFVAGKFFFIGVLIAIWAAIMQIVMPIWKMTSFVLFNRALEKQRWRAIGVTAASLLVFVLAVFVVPVPVTTRAEGVLWLPDQAQVQAGTKGVVAELLVEPFSRVEPGQPLVALDDPMLTSRVQVLDGQVAELKARYRVERETNPVEAGVIKEQIIAAQAERHQEAERADQLVVRSQSSGVFVLRRPDDLLGKFLQQGDQIGLVLDDASMIVRVVVPQQRIGLIRESVEEVEVKLADSIARTLPAQITRDVPGAQTRLPSPVLGSNGGGSIPVQPGDDEGVTPVQSVFALDITLGIEPEVWRIGQRAYVKFEHGRQPLAQQWVHAARQVFLSRFGT